jgi:hypothetical protein
VVELTAHARRLPGEETAQRAEGLVGAAPARPGVDTADLDLVAVLAADPHAQHEPTGRRLAQRGDLSRHGHRVAQREQVDADIRAHARLQCGDRRGLDEAIHAEARVEAHVVGHEHVVETARRNALEQRAPPRQGTGEHLRIGQGAEA